MTSTVTYDPTLGPDVPQGDILLTNLRHPVFGGRWADRAPSGTPERTREGAIRLLEGEVTGHFHEVVFGSRALARFRDDGLARDLAVTAPVAIGTASLVRDDALLTDLIRSGHWHERARALHIGFLVVEGGPVDLIHPEHDTWRLPEGVYSVGRQIESAGADERLIAD